MLEEDVRDLMFRVLEHVSYYDDYPRVSVFNEEGIVVRGEVDETFYELLKAVYDLVEGD